MTREQADATEKLEEYLARSWSYESRDAHGKEHLETTLIGQVFRGNMVYDVYIDTENNTWFKIRYKTERGIISEFEYIFGHPEHKTQQRKRA